MGTPKFIGYVRVSTEDQAEHGVSLDAQEAKVRAFAESRGLGLLEVISDPGESAKSLNRPGLRRALQALELPEADGGGLVVAKLDRLTRSVRDWSHLVESAFGRPGGPTLESASESFDLRSAAGRLVANIMMSTYQWERESAIERTRVAMSAKSSKGHRLGTIPYGWHLGADGKTLEMSPLEQLRLGTIRDLGRSGHSIREIARLLDQGGVPSRSGQSWSPSTVGKLLRSPPAPGPP